MLPLSLDNSPSLYKTFVFYFIAMLFLILFSSYQLLNQGSIDDRWSNQTIVLIHLFSIGYLTPIIIGSLTQFLPVLYGIQIPYRLFLLFIFSIPIALLSYAINFHNQNLENNLINILAISLLWISIFLFSGNLFYRAIMQFLNQRKEIALLLSESFFNFVIAVFISIYLMMIHFGFPFSDFRPHITNFHLQIMILGFLFPLTTSILSNVIPMFYIANATSRKIILLSTFVTPLLYFKIFTNNFPTYSNVFSILLILLIIIISTSFIFQLYTRKRKTKDHTIYLWYFTFTCTIACSLIWLFNIFGILENQIAQLLIGKILFMGVILSITSVMLLKIIPFLCWLHLSRAQVTNNRYDIKIPHLGVFLINKEKLMINLFIISNLIFHLLGLYTLSSITLFALATIIMRIIIRGILIHKDISGKIIS